MKRIQQCPTCKHWLNQDKPSFWIFAVLQYFKMCRLENRTIDLEYANRLQISTSKSSIEIIDVKLYIKNHKHT